MALTNWLVVACLPVRRAGLLEDARLAGVDALDAGRLVVPRDRLPEPERPLELAPVRDRALLFAVLLPFDPRLLFAFAAPLPVPPRPFEFALERVRELPARPFRVPEVFPDAFSVPAVRRRACPVRWAIFSSLSGVAVPGPSSRYTSAELCTRAPIVRLLAPNLRLGQTRPGARFAMLCAMREQDGQQAVEMIMAQGMMANLSTPAFLVDRAGTLVFFNAPAGRLLGVSYEEAGAMAQEEWASRFSPTTGEGEPLALSELPLAVAVSDGRPAHRVMQIVGADGAAREIEVSAFPIVGRTGQTGAMAIFWNGR